MPNPKRVSLDERKEKAKNNDEKQEEENINSATSSMVVIQSASKSLTLYDLPGSSGSTRFFVDDDEDVDPDEDLIAKFLSVSDDDGRPHLFESSMDKPKKGVLKNRTKKASESMSVESTNRSIRSSRVSYAPSSSVYQVFSSEGPTQTSQPIQVLLPETSSHEIKNEEDSPYIVPLSPEFVEPGSPPIKKFKVGPIIQQRISRTNVMFKRKSIVPEIPTIVTPTHAQIDRTIKLKGMAADIQKDAEILENKLRTQIRDNVKRMIWQIRRELNKSRTFESVSSDMSLDRKSTE